jgi:7-cyano-7-deazaguanine synthase in queuosine biosynthesis
MELDESMPIIEAINVTDTLSRSDKSIETSIHPEMLDAIIRTSIDCPERPENFFFKVKRIRNSWRDKICLLSGGVDSTIAWYYAGKPFGVYIDIGQPYRDKELAAIRYFTDDFEVFEGPNLFQDRDENWKHIIPGRNFLFLTIAAEYLGNGGELHFAVTEGEGFNSGKGDKSEKFIFQFLQWYIKTTGKVISIKTLAQDTKAGWLKWFNQQHEDKTVEDIRHHTVTCFKGTEKPCGECQGCVRKYLSYIAAFSYCDISEDFLVHPMIGAKQYVDKYKIKMNEAIENKDFSHYSEKRCREDLAAIELAETRMKAREEAERVIHQQ